MIYSLNDLQDLVATMATITWSEKYNRTRLSINPELLNYIPMRHLRSLLKCEDAIISYKG